MFGLLKKKVKTEDLLDIMDRQADALKGLLSLYISLEERIAEKNAREIPDLTTVMDKICGEWYSRKLDISVTIKKYGDGYFAEIGDAGNLPGYFAENYPVRLHNNMAYFVLEGYAIFMEYNAEIHELCLCGKLSLLRKEAGSSLFQSLDINPN